MYANHAPFIPTGHGQLLILPLESLLQSELSKPSVKLPLQAWRLLRATFYARRVSVPSPL